ncbi:MAG: porin [Phycisphaeraceae bacterium]
MSRIRTAGILGGAVLCGLSSLAQADPAQQPQDVSSRIAALEAQVSQLKGESWLTERRAEEVKTLVREVLADADTRASLQGDGITAGYDGKNFMLSNADKTFLMTISGQIQFRYIYNHRENTSTSTTLGTGPGATAGSPAVTTSSTSTADADQHGFQVRRTKLNIAGYVGNPKITYDIVLAAERDTELVYLEDVVLGYKVMDNLEIRGGRYKQPFLREELTSSKRQTAVERSSFNEFFTLNRGEGVGATWSSEMIKVAAMFHDGAQSGEVGGVSNEFSAGPADLAVAARVDVKLLGESNWKQMDDFAAWKGEPLAIFLGAAVDYERGREGDAQGTVGWDDMVSYTIDGSVEYQGINLYAAFAGRHISSASAGAPSTLEDFGFLVQGGYMINDKVEPFVRYEWISPDGPGLTDVQIVTVGANYYIKKHNAKFTVDLVWGMDPLRFPSSSVAARTSTSGSPTSSGLGLQSDIASQENQIAIRAQFQLLF